MAQPVRAGPECAGTAGIGQRAAECSIAARRSARGLVGTPSLRIASAGVGANRG